MNIRSDKYLRLLLIGAVIVAALGYAIADITSDDSGQSVILLNGTIVTPDEVIPDGWVLVRGGKIDLVSASKPDTPQSIEVDTGGIIFPGLIDLHNHISYDVFPRWHPSHLFSDRYEWRDDPDFIKHVSAPYDYLLKHDYFCEMNTYGELRALVGGTTSVLSTANSKCIRGLVRNLDYSSGFYSFLVPDSVHIDNVVNLQSTTDRATINGIKSFLASSRSEMFIVHLSEGVDAASLDEFYYLQEQGLLTSKTAIIHGIPLRQREFESIHKAGASLVWSPRSNIELYGETADIPTAIHEGVRIALGPDWSITGSSNMMDELSYAAQWNDDHFSDRLTDQQLVSMVTITAAKIAGIDDEVGSIREGLYADLLVISGDRENPYRALINAQPRDVQLVLINGQPIYGARGLMGKFWKTTDLDEVNIDGKAKLIKMSPLPFRYNELVSVLQSALASQGTSLAPLTDNR